MNMNTKIKDLYECQINIMRLEKEKAHIENDLIVARMEEKKLILDSFETSDLTLGDLEDEEKLILDSLETSDSSIQLDDKLLENFIWGPNEIKQTLKWQEEQQQEENIYTDTGTKKVQTLKNETTYKTQVCTSDDKHFSLYTDTDNQHLNQVHVLIRQFILEGYVVNTNTKHNMNSKCNSQTKRYANTVGFRCQWCKHVKSIDRAKLASVYPRTKECIYKSVIRFQKHHIL